MNPFKISSVELKSKFYTDFVLSQVEDVRIGESKAIELGGRTASVFRMTLRYALHSRMPTANFKTKTASNGSLWVMRIS